MKNVGFISFLGLASPLGSRKSLKTIGFIDIFEFGRHKRRSTHPKGAPRAPTFSLLLRCKTRTFIKGPPTGRPKGAKGKPKGIAKDSRGGSRVPRRRKNDRNSQHCSCVMFSVDFHEFRHRKASYSAGKRGDSENALEAYDEIC